MTEANAAGFLSASTAIPSQQTKRDIKSNVPRIPSPGQPVQIDYNEWVASISSNSAVSSTSTPRTSQDEDMSQHFDFESAASSPQGLVSNSKQQRATGNNGLPFSPFSQFSQFVQSPVKNDSLSPNSFAKGSEFSDANYGDYAGPLSNNKTKAIVFSFDGDDTQPNYQWEDELSNPVDSKISPEKDEQRNSITPTFEISPSPIPTTAHVQQNITQLPLQDQLQENMHLPYKLRILGIPENGAKSRVETQVRLELELLNESENRITKYQWLRIRPYAVAKAKLKLESLKEKPQNFTPQNTVLLEASVVCATEPHRVVNICSGCILREVCIELCYI